MLLSGDLQVIKVQLKLSKKQLSQLEIHLLQSYQHQLSLF